MPDKEQKPARNDYQKPEVKKEGELKDITAGETAA